MMTISGNFHIGWPQGIYLSLMVVSLLVQGCVHGRPRTGTYDVIASLINAVVILWLLAWGGFFS